MVFGPHFRMNEQMLQSACILGPSDRGQPPAGAGPGTSSLPAVPGANSGSWGVWKVGTWEGQGPGHLQGGTEMYKNMYFNSELYCVSAS